MTELKDKYVDVKWVCEYTGLGTSTIYQLADPNQTPQEKLIPSYKPTAKKGAMRFKISEVERWMQRNKQRAS